MSKKILVLGGTGFIGQAVCRRAVDAGHDVVSVARHGRPDDVDGDWADRVDWKTGNVLQADTWREHLDGCDAVVHCVGILKEHPDEGITFERVSRDSVDIASWEAQHAGVDRFVYVSAKDNPPFVSDRYLSSKREGEQVLRARGMHEAILRPQLVYGPDRPSSVVAARTMNAAGKIPGLGDVVHANRPLRVEQVATAAVRAATEEGYEGIITLDLIEYLAEGHWEPDGAPAASAPRANSRWLGGALLAGFVGGAAWGWSRR